MQPKVITGAGKNKRITFAVLLCLFAVSLAGFASAQAQTAFRTVDPRTFEVAGVKLGMGYDDTVAALVTYFKLPPSDEYETRWTSFGFVPSVFKEEVIPKSLAYHSEDGRFSVEVEFSVRIPINKARSVAVSSIHLREKAATPTLTPSAVLAKYGAPSAFAYEDKATNVKYPTYEWCINAGNAKTETAGHCAPSPPFKPQAIMRYSAGNINAELKFETTKDVPGVAILWLHDRTYAEAERGYFGGKSPWSAEIVPCDGCKQDDADLKAE